MARSTVWIDPPGGPGVLDLLYRGDLVMLTKLPSVAALAEHTRQSLRELFAPHDPQLIHQHLDDQQLAAMLGRWKPTFMRDATTVALTKGIIADAGFDPAETHLDLPKFRTAFPSGRLASGIAFAFPWHRDTWYSAPAQQINWWLPVWDVRPDNAMGFDCASFAASVPNTSDRFDYYETNRMRAGLARHTDRDPMARPGAIDHGAADETVVLPSPGSVLLFSGAQLHRTIPNTSPFTRYSIDFRMVVREDVASGRGAPMVDVHCTGTALRDFVNVATGERFDEAFVRAAHPETPPEGAILIFEPEQQG